jgi:tetratricopeptide (TPR) repeat protein
MIMKTNVTLLITFLIVWVVNGQDCVEKLSIFSELAKVKNYKEAYPFLQQLRKDCPSQHQAIYIFGEPTLNYMIENATTPNEKEEQVRDLMKLYGEFDTNFPNNGRGNTVKKAMTLFLNKVGTKDEVYTILDKVFKTDLENFTNFQALYVYFEIYVDDFEKGDKGIQLQQVFDKYDLISDKLEVESKNMSDEKDALLQKQESGTPLTTKEERDFKRFEINLENIETVISSMDSKIESLATCDRLVPFFEKSFEEKKGDAEWLRRAATRLDRKNCSGDPLFGKISDALHLLNPTAESAYNLGVSYYNKKNNAKALEYFNQSAELQKDNVKKANIYYTIAANIYGNSNKTQARVYAEKALAARPSMGRAYLFIAQLYANSVNECNDDPFDKRAIYWLAAQTARRAGQVDSTLKNSADQAAAAYEQRAPSRQEIFTSGKAGQNIPFRCWVGKSVTVPNL